MRRLSGQRGQARAILVGIFVWLATAASAAASGATTAGSTPGAGTQAATGPSATPTAAVRGGWLTLGILADPGTMNPYLVAEEQTVACQRPLYNSLLRFNERLEPVPDLAQTAVAAPDGKSVTIRLRQGVKFHDGATLTPADVRATLDWLASPGSSAVRTRAVRWMARDPKDHGRILWQAKDTGTFVLTYTRAYAPALADLADTPILEAKGLEADRTGRLAGDKPVGTGPYRFVERKADALVALEAFDDHFRGRPHLDRLVFKVVPDLNTRLAALERGELDTAEISATQARRQLGPDVLERFDLILTDTLMYAYVVFNGDPARGGPLAESRVRQAIKLAIDRRRIIDRTLEGDGQIPAGPFHPSHWAADTGQPPAPHDPARAGALLDQAGWMTRDADGVRTNGSRHLELVLKVYAGSPTAQRRVTLIADDLAKVGIKVAIQPVEWNVLAGRDLPHGEFDAAYLTVDLVPDPDPSSQWHSSQIPTGANPGGLNVSRLADKQVDDLLDRALGTTDLHQRASLYHRLQARIEELTPAVFLYVAPEYRLLSRRVRWPDELAHRSHDARLDRDIGHLGPLGLLTQDFWLGAWIPPDQRSGTESR